MKKAIPAGRQGFYLYCLRKKSPALIKAVKTIDMDSTSTSAVSSVPNGSPQEGEVSTLPYEELEAVVSEVSLGKFSSEEIQKKAQEDVNWIKEKAQVHQHVIEQAMGVEGKMVPVIPMKFGTIFKTKKNLEEMLKENCVKFKKVLKNLEGKQEWGVKVYLNAGVFEKHLEEESEELAQKKKEIASLPKGMDFFVKKQMEEVMKKEKNRKLRGVLKEIFENLQKLAIRVSQGKNLDKTLTGKKEQMILNANLLIKEEKVSEFQKEVNELKANYKNLGLIIQESGPWPPYNFVS